MKKKKLNYNVNHIMLLLQIFQKIEEKIITNKIIKKLKTSLIIFRIIKIKEKNKKI